MPDSPILRTDIILPIPNNSRRFSRRRVVQMLALAPVLAALDSLAGEAGAAEPQASAGDSSTRPMLRIEAGMHTSPARQIVFSPDGKTMYTAGHDQTIRVWSFPGGQPLRILRIPIGEYRDAKITSLAISPDGKMIACCGWFSYGNERVNCIYLLDALTGTLKRRISGLAHRGHCVGFSKDGAYLAVGLDGPNGVRLFRVADGQEIASDLDYQDNCISLDFDAGGRIAAVGFDNHVRIYSPGLQLLAKVKAPGARGLWSVRFSPDGNKIAVGHSDMAMVNIYSTQPGTDLLSLLYNADTSGTNPGNLSVVAWSSDGCLWAGGSYNNGNPAGSYPVRRWLNGGKGEYRDLPASGNTLFDLRPLPAGGGMAFAAADPTFGVFDSSGHRVLRHESATADYRDQQEKLLIDSTGDTVAIGYERFGAAPARFSVRQRSLVVRDSSNASDFDSTLSTMIPPTTQSMPGLAVTDWKDQWVPRLNGRPLTILIYELSKSLAIAPSRSSFLVGTAWNIRCFDRDGGLLWQYAAPDYCFALNITAGNGGIAVGAFADGTIRWIRMRDGQELLALFLHADRKRWVCWTPSGYYDCSPGGEDLIGWHINRGADVTPDFYPASRFRNIFYRPDIIPYVLTTLDENEALRLANADRTKAPGAANATTVAANLPPTVIIRTPANFAPFSENTVTVKVTVRAPVDAPVTQVTARVDGRPVPLQRSMDFAKVTPSAVPGGQGETQYEVPVPVPSRDCEVAIFAENKNTISAPAVVHLKWASAPLPDAAVVKPKLYILAVGVGDYQSDTIPKLTYPAKDASDFVAALQHQKGGLYRDIEVCLLTDKQATRDSVVDAMEWIQTNTTSRDVAMVFFAGHGTNSANQVFHFLPYDFAPTRFKATGIARSDIESTLEQIPGKVFFFLDSCDSGNVLGTAKSRGDVDITGILNELSSAESGVVVFCASGKFQSALEDANWHNGAFTKALLEAITGHTADPAPGKDAAAILAALRQSGKVTIPLLQSYVAERVKDLTSGRQSPSFPPVPTNSLNNLTLAVIGGE